MLVWHRRRGKRAARHEVARVDPFDSLPLLVGLPRRQTALLRRRFDPVSFPEGTVMACGDEPRPQLVVVTRGQALAADGGRTRLLGPGDHFGELTVLLREPRGPTVRAMTAVEALVLSRRDFWGVLHAVPALGIRLLARLGERLAEAEAPARSDLDGTRTSAAR